MSKIHKLSRFPVVLVTLTVILTLAMSTSSVLAQGKKKGGGPRYKLIELAHRPGDAYGINNFGECVGAITDDDELYKPYFWMVDAAGGVTALPLSTQSPPGEPILTQGSAQDINDDSLIVGYVVEPAGPMFAACWPNALAYPILLPEANDSIDSFAYAVNANGVIVGSYRDASGLPHPVAWGLRVDGTIAGPVEMQAGPDSIGIAENVNDSQAVVGWHNAGSSAEAWQWQLTWDGNTLGLEGGSSLTPLFPAGSYVYSYAHDINNRGDICGYRNPGGRAEPYSLINLDGVLTERALPILVDNKRTGSANNFARALNNADPPQIVGEGSTYSRKTGFTQGFFALLWQGETIVNLRQSASSPTLTASPYMWAVNDSGWIAGRAWTGETEIPGVPSVIIENK